MFQIGRGARAFKTTMGGYRDGSVAKDLRLIHEYPHRNVRCMLRDRDSKILETARQPFYLDWGNSRFGDRLFKKQTSKMKNRK